MNGTFSDRLRATCCAPLTLPAATAASSRRRRLWELGTHAHCPVVGVCLRMDAMRRLARKLLVLQGDEDDYTLHWQLVTAAARRNGVSEALQRELESRYALDVQQATKHKCQDSLSLWWRTRAAQGEIAGPLWATLTHPRCGEWLEMRVLGQVHMLQHQVGAAQRVDLQRHQEVLAEHQALSREYASAQQRITQWAQERQQEQAQWERERVLARGRELALQTRLQQAEAALRSLHAQMPELGERLALQSRLQAMIERNRLLQRELGRLRDRSPLMPSPEPQESANHVARPAAPCEPAQLLQRVVLCVGGRAGQVPLYREAVEGCGARFLHHDGGEEQRLERLDPQLAAADLVICQTGCISHDAYWRVKDHCKRHGKRCMFVETPSRSAFERALQEAAQATPPGNQID